MALVMLARRGSIEHVGRGIYRFPELAGDQLAQYQEALVRFPGAVLTHDTALLLHDLADVNPRRVHVTLSKAFRARKAIPAWMEIHRADIGPADVTDHDGLAIATPARAIIDAIEADLGQRFVDQAIETARRRNLMTSREEQAVEQALATRSLAQHEAGRAR